MFDDKLSWELEKCEIYFPVENESCLPSDCKYREDSIAFENNDMKLA